MVSQPAPARLHSHWVNLGLDEAAGRIWVMAPADGGQAADALLGQGTALGHGRMVAGVGGVPVA